MAKVKWAIPFNANDPILKLNKKGTTLQRVRVMAVPPKIHYCPHCGKPQFKGELQGKLKIQCRKCKQWFEIKD